MNAIYDFPHPIYELFMSVAPYDVASKNIPNSRLENKDHILFKTKTAQNCLSYKSTLCSLELLFDIFLCDLKANEIYPSGLVKHCLMKFVNVLGMCGLMKSIRPLLPFPKSNVS